MRALLASVLAVLGAPGLAAAMIPTGSFELHFGGRQSIWMGEEGVDAGEEFCAGLAAAFDPLELCDFQMFVDGRGKIFGSVEFSGWNGGLHFTERGSIKGTQRGDDRSGISRLELRIRLTGIASDGSAQAPTRSRMRFSGQVTSEGLVSGEWVVRVCITGFGCNEAEEPLPPTILTNGGWSLALDITDAGDGELGGGARVEFGDGSECYYSVSGRYRESRDTARLRLAPTEPACEGTRIRLKDVRLLIGPDDISGSIAYRLFGFRGDTTFNLPLQRLLLDYYLEQVPNPNGFICEGATEITASFDPSTCRWALEPIPLEGSFGRRTYTYIEGVLGGIQTGSYEIREPRLEMLGASATVTVIGLP